MTSYICIGKGKTDANGVAQLTHDCQGNQLQTPGYTGQGKGKLNIIASTDGPSVIDSGSVVSQPSTVYDCTFYHDGVTDSGGLYYPTPANFEVTTDDTGTSVLNKTSSNQTIRAKYANSTELQFSDVSQIEFDIESISGTVILQLWKTNNTGDAVGLNISDAMSGYSLTSAHITVKTTGSRIIFNVNTNEKQNSSFSFVSSGNMSVRVVLGNGASFKYKNFKIYPI